MYEDMLITRDSLREQLVALESSPGGGRQAVREQLTEQINAINRIFGEDAEDYDPVIAKWERDIAEGKSINFSERHMRG
jgi:hypothetical protein